MQCACYHLQMGDFCTDKKVCGSDFQRICQDRFAHHRRLRRRHSRFQKRLFSHSAEPPWAASTSVWMAFTASTEG